MSSSFSTLVVSDKIFFSKWGSNVTSDDLFAKFSLFDRVSEYTLVRFLNNNLFIERDLEVGGQIVANVFSVDGVLFRNHPGLQKTQTKAFLDSYYDTILEADTILESFDIANSTDSLVLKSGKNITIQNASLIMQGTSLINQTTSSGTNIFSNISLKTNNSLLLSGDVTFSGSGRINQTNSNPTNVFGNSVMKNSTTLQFGDNAYITQGYVNAATTKNLMARTSFIEDVKFLYSSKIDQTETTGVNLLSSTTFKATATITSPGDLVFTSAGKINQTNSTGSNVFGTTSFKTSSTITTPGDVIFTDNAKINQSASSGTNTMSSITLNTASSLSLSGDATTGIRMQSKSNIRQDTSATGLYAESDANQFGISTFIRTGGSPSPTLSTFDMVSGRGFFFVPNLGNGSYNAGSQSLDSGIIGRYPTSGMGFVISLQTGPAIYIRISSYTLANLTAHSQFTLRAQTTSLVGSSHLPGFMITGDIYHRPKDLTDLQGDPSLISSGFTSALNYGSLQFDNSSKTYRIGNRMTDGVIDFMFTTNNGTNMFPVVRINKNGFICRNFTSQDNGLAILPLTVSGSKAIIQIAAQNFSGVDSEMHFVVTNTDTNVVPVMYLSEQGISQKILPKDLSAPSIGWNYQYYNAFTIQSNTGTTQNVHSFDLLPGAYIGTVFFRKTSGAGQAANIATLKFGLSELSNGYSSYSDSTNWTASANYGLTFISHFESAIILQDGDLFRRSCCSPFQLNTGTVQTLYIVYDSIWSGGWNGHCSFGVSIVRVA